MKITLAVITAKKLSNKGTTGQLLHQYVDRAARYVPTAFAEFSTEDHLLKSLDARAGRTPATLVLADSRGKQMTSDEIAATLGAFQDTGAQHIILAIGPADGWSTAARNRAEILLAFGKITLPHELAAVVAAEQIYRALTIIAGHPYHRGH